MREAVITLLIFVSLTAANAEPSTLTLACKGKITAPAAEDAKSEPISMGIIVNFGTGTVQGFGVPGVLDYPIKVTGSNDVTVAFGGEQEFLGTSVSSTSGSIDRVTGDVEAIILATNKKTGQIISSTRYVLTCKPTQRMF